MVASKVNKRRTEDWYTVSVETLRGLGLSLIVLALAGVGYWVYRQWEARAQEREARAVVEEASGLVEEVGRRRQGTSFAQEFREAWTSLEEARGHLAEAAFGEALAAGRRSRSLLQSILDALRDRSLSGEAQFVAVQGEVEYRRGDRGAWEAARSRQVLLSGDYVKTSARGSAEIVFLDGTLYTVRPNTLFLVTRTRAGAGGPGEQAIAMEYGWVNLNTSERGSRVTTPRAEARVGRQSEAVVAFDEKSATGRFASFRGEMAVAAREGGGERVLGALEQVMQTGDRLAEKRPVPARPTLVDPPDHADYSLDATRSLALAWQPSGGAARYALQVSRNRLFVDNLVDVDGRTKNGATLGLRGPGTFLWRVAAVSRDGIAGPWSEPRSFRVIAARRSGGEADKTPPRLEVDEVQSYGSLFMVGGRTEAGAAVTINGEPVAVAVDGSFTKTVQFGNDGWSFVEIRSRDAAGNEAVRRRRVFVETL